MKRGHRLVVQEHTSRPAHQCNACATICARTHTYTLHILARYLRSGGMPASASPAMRGAAGIGLGGDDRIAHCMVTAGRGSRLCRPSRSYRRTLESGTYVLLRSGPVCARGGGGSGGRSEYRDLVLDSRSRVRHYLKIFLIMLLIYNLPYRSLSAWPHMYIQVTARNQPSYLTATNKRTFDEFDYDSSCLNPRKMSSSLNIPGS